jgi:hypothetical protein
VLEDTHSGGDNSCFLSPRPLLDDHSLMQAREYFRQYRGSKKGEAQQNHQADIPSEVTNTMAVTSSGSLDPEEDTRFHCPHPGCKRSFVELWRLKVHYRAPSDVRGSGKERGHGAELPVCPRCWQILSAQGSHHTNCIVACSKRKVPTNAVTMEAKELKRAKSTAATEIDQAMDNLQMLAEQAGVLDV